MLRKRNNHELTLVKESEIEVGNYFEEIRDLLETCILAKISWLSQLPFSIECALIMVGASQAGWIRCGLKSFKKWASVKHFSNHVGTIRIYTYLTSGLSGIHELFMPGVSTMDCILRRRRVVTVGTTIWLSQSTMT